jgi:fatty-acyl-CoA synthase
VDISGWIAHWASWTPQKTALRFEGKSISYARLERNVGSAAAWLRGNGVSRGDRVAYLGPNCPELLELLFACARLGAIFVPLNARMPAAELAVFVELTEPRLLLVERDFEHTAVESLERSPAGHVVPFAIGAEPDWAATAPRVPADPALDLATPALIAFTSGTTGRPKGATLTHENFTFNALNVMTAFGLTGEDEILTATPMSHAGGLLIHTTPGVCAGATTTIHRQFDPGLMLEDIARHRVTLVTCVPTMTFAVAREPAWDAADVSSLRAVVTGSTVVPQAAIEPWQRKGVGVAQGYGMTETCPIVTTMTPRTPNAARTVGKPVLYAQIRVVDEGGLDVATGERGEVWIKGRSVMVGYWDNPQATRAAFRDGWFRTGDVGQLDEDGCLHIVDRVKDVIIVGGSNVYPSDLEAVLDGCADIREAAVLGRRDDELGEVPVACVVPADARVLAREHVIGLFAGRLATYKHPRDVVVLDALPRNSSGKVDKVALRDLVARQHAPSRSSPVSADRYRLARLALRERRSRHASADDSRAR